MSSIMSNIFSCNPDLVFLHSQTLQNKLEDDANQEHRTLPSAFVIFRSLRMTTTAVQIEWDNSPLNIENMQAPEVSNVIWSNLGVGLWRRCADLKTYCAKKYSVCTYSATLHVCTTYTYR